MKQDKGFEIIWALKLFFFFLFLMLQLDLNLSLVCLRGVLNPYFKLQDSFDGGSKNQKVSSSNE
jgi:hypothetical protein